MIKPCKCGDNGVSSKAKVSGFAECFYDDIGHMADEQNIDMLKWDLRTTVYCVSCQKRRKDLRILQGILTEVK